MILTLYKLKNSLNMLIFMLYFKNKKYGKNNGYNLA